MALRAGKLPSCYVGDAEDTALTKGDGAALAKNPAERVDAILREILRRDGFEGAGFSRF